MPRTTLEHFRESGWIGIHEILWHPWDHHGNITQWIVEKENQVTTDCDYIHDSLHSIHSISLSLALSLTVYYFLLEVFEYNNQRNAKSMRKRRLFDGYFDDKTNEFDEKNR